jgi:hypothetical protein
VPARVLRPSVAGGRAPAASSRFPFSKGVASSPFPQLGLATAASVSRDELTVKEVGLLLTGAAYLLNAILPK